MLKRIRIENLGAHVDTTLTFDPTGVSHIKGPSESGKSLVVTAALLAALGVDHKGKSFSVADIRTGAPKASVTLTTAKGADIFRSMTRGKSQRRKFNGDVCSTETVFAKAHGLGRKVAGVHAMYIITAPMSWCPLADGPGGGRPLRDVLATFAAGTDRDEVSSLMGEAGHKLRSGEDIKPKTVEVARKAAKTARDKASGKLDGAKGREVVVPDAPDAGRLAEARTIIADAAEWATHRTDAEHYGVRLGAYQVAAKRVADWDSAIADLGVEPDSTFYVAERRVVAAFEEWAHHESGAAGYRLREVLHAGKAKLVADWDGALADLGDKPPSNAKAIAKARKASVDAESGARVAREAVRVATEKRNRLRAEAPWVDEVLQTAAAMASDAAAASDKAEADGDTCSKCERPEWPQAAAQIEALRVEWVAASKALTSAKRGAKGRAETESTRRAHALADAESELKRLTAALKAADDKASAKGEALLAAGAGSGAAARWVARRGALGDRPAEPAARPAAPTAPTSSKPEAQAVQDAVSTLKAAERAAATWTATRKSLGTRPAEPAAQPEAPAQPTSPRPGSALVEDANATLRSAERAAGAIEQATREQASAAKALAKATTAFASASLEATRAEALVEAVRAAPAARLAQGVAALGDIGPVSIGIPEAKKEGDKVDALEVLVDGLPWHKVSEGKLIYADAYFRAGLRRALEMTWCPLAVDGFQNWSGELPDIAGPVWYFRTVSDGGLRTTQEGE